MMLYLATSSLLLSQQTSDDTMSRETATTTTTTTSTTTTMMMSEHFDKTATTAGEGGEGGVGALPSAPRGRHAGTGGAGKVKAKSTGKGEANSSRYKTELCRQFSENGECKYGDKCQFAHGFGELKDVSRHPKYKTDFCKTFHSKGFCPYGPRCHFIHDLSETSELHKTYISCLNSKQAFKNLLKSKRNFAAQKALAEGKAGKAGTLFSPLGPPLLEAKPTPVVAAPAQYYLATNSQYLDMLYGGQASGEAGLVHAWPTPAYLSSSLSTTSSSSSSQSPSSSSSLASEETKFALSALNEPLVDQIKLFGIDENGVFMQSEEVPAIVIEPPQPPGQQLLLPPILTPPTSSFLIDNVAGLNSIIAARHIGNT